MTHKVEAVKHTDIRGKEQLYLVIGEGANKVVVNIGERTFNAVQKLNGAEQKTVKK